MSNSQPRKHSEGFALVIALSLMSFVLLLLLSMSTLVQVESQSSQNSMSRVEAEQAALLGLSIAIGELQKTAGPDQRVTAAADVLSDSSNLYSGGLSVPVGQNSWTGVWKSGTVAVGTPSYSPATPNTRSFAGWLVSGTDASGNYELPITLNSVETDVSAGSNSISLAKNSDDLAYAQVEKVKVGDETLKETYFAFHVDDESRKADLSWSEIPSATTTNERYQSSRISVAAGPDYAVLNGKDNDGPFGGSDVSYPLSLDSSDILTDIYKISSTADITAKMSDASAASNWLKNNRANFTFGTRGVLADVKFGGLRRDLSLAFEMDGDADINSTEQPDKFNAQVGEFTGNGDRLSSPTTAIGMPVAERFLYRDFQASGTPFSSSIVRSDAVLRGPNWWALRDYANLYKRLRFLGGDYELDARSYYPNRSGSAKPYSSIFGLSAYRVWDAETVNGNYVYMPARPNYGPVYLGSVSLLSLLPSGGSLALGVDPIFYIWNPYNRKLTFESMAVVFKSYAFPGQVVVWTDSGGTEQRHGPFALRDFFAANSTFSGTTLTYLLSDSGSSVTMNPGEVLVFSANAAVTGSSSVNRSVANLGYNLTNSSGILMTEFPAYSYEEPDPTDPDVTRVVSVDVQSIPFDSGVDTAGFNYVKGTTGGSSRFIVATSLPASGTNELDLDTEANWGEEMQYSQHNLTRWSRDGFNHYISPLANVNTANVEPESLVDPFVSLNGKRYFGMFTLLKKPADFGDNDGNEMEVFEFFNPMNALYSVDHWLSTHHNQVFNLISSSDSNDLVNNNGINFPVTDNGNWGEAYTASGSTSVPFIDIPTGPLYSLAAFSNGNFSIISGEPMKIAGKSRANPYLSPESIYGEMLGYTPNLDVTAQDTPWLMNDALFDRYYLSGIAPDFTISASGYQNTGTIEDSLTSYFSSNYTDAKANPVLRAYLPEGLDATEAISQLAADDGYLKLGAYSLINGIFNVNSTSVVAWEAFLRSNRDIAIEYADGGSETTSGTPFPSANSPVSPTVANPYWSGFSRLSDAKISQLASEIVNQVKLRGPFMSISDFVNRRTGLPLNNDTHYSGALQAAIDLSAVNSTVESSGSGVTPDYVVGVFPNMPNLGSRATTTGIPGEINQVELLMSLAPRITARSDTFRIRSFGESRSAGLGDSATEVVCEAIIQRFPEYLDETDAPWDEASNPISMSSSSLTTINDLYGRRYKIISFRWLSKDEI